MTDQFPNDKTTFHVSYRTDTFSGSASFDTRGQAESFAAERERSGADSVTIVRTVSDIVYKQGEPNV